MRPVAPTVAAACLGLAFGVACHAQVPSADPRLKEIWYDPRGVVTVPVKRGVVTHVLLDAGEAIAEVGAGLGSDCAKPEASWCVAAQPGGRNLFIKPKSTAVAPNNLAVVTERRSYALRFVPLADGDSRPPVYRLSIRVPAANSPVAPPSLSLTAPDTFPALGAQAEAPAEVIARRLGAAPVARNANYSLARGPGSDDIVPTLVFDDGRFTYLRFPNNREIPAAFHVLGDGTETVVNARMEGDLLVVDRVSRRLMLRSGSAVVGIFNDAFDLDGVPPAEGTTVVGVKRVMRPAPGDPNATSMVKENVP